VAYGPLDGHIVPLFKCPLMNSRVSFCLAWEREYIFPGIWWLVLWILILLHDPIFVQVGSCGILLH
jgi:hypothetical protein